MNMWPWNRIRELEKALEAWKIAAQMNEDARMKVSGRLRDEMRKSDSLGRLLHKYERNDMTDRAHRCKQCGYVYKTWRGAGNRPLDECPICGQHIAHDYGYEGTD